MITTRITVRMKAAAANEAESRRGRDTAWVQLRHSRTQADGTRVDKRGVILFGVEEGLLARGRIYLEQSETWDETWQELYEVGN